MAVNRAARGFTGQDRVDLSVIIPIFNESPTLEELSRRLRDMLDRLGKTYETIFVDDGSTDDSARILRMLYEQDSNVTVVRLSRNFGQHPAILAGLERARGEIIVTLDGDLQNPPEEIPKLLEKIREGYEVVGGQRTLRHDPLGRRILSFLVSRVASRLVGVPMKDYGCMLRAYRRSVVNRILQSAERSTYIPALANALAASVTEVPVAHQPRVAGHSKYSLFRLLRLAFDLVTGFSFLPLRVVGAIGFAMALAGIALGFAVGLYSALGSSPGIFLGLSAFLLFFGGVQLLALGLIGEYVGRISMVLRGRPCYGIREVWE